MEARGKTIIKVVSVLFIIGGALSTITYLLALLFGSAGAVTGVANVQADGTAMVLALMVLYLIWSILMLVGGIIGIKNSGKPEAAKTLISFGIILIVASLIVNIYRIMIVGASSATVVPLVSSLLLPVLYIMGAKKNQEV